MTSPPFPSEIRFGSFLVYPSPATGADAQKAKNLILALKQDRFTSREPPVTIIQAVVSILAGLVADTSLVNVLGADVTLVPLPKSAPLVKDAVWPSRSICEALVSVGLGRDWHPLIERVLACEKSAYCRPPDRPTPRRHYDTMAAVRQTVAPSTIVLVDDLVTKGATAAGAATRLREIFPDAEIRAFSIARTSSDFREIQEPCTGRIIVDAHGTSSYRRDEC